MLTRDKYKLVYIEWVDSCGGSGEWRKVEDLSVAELAVQVSVGYLIQDGELLKTVCPHITLHDENEKMAYVGQGEISIPVSAIRVFKELIFSS